MLALAVMVTQARFIAKRETTGLEQAMATTSTDPDIVKAPRESGIGREPVAIKAESDMFSSQTNIEDEKSAKTVDQTETQTASPKENLNVKQTTAAFEKNESSNTTESHLNGAQVDPVQELKDTETPADTVKEESSTTTTSQLDQNPTNVTDKKSTEAQFKDERLSKEILSTTTEQILLTEKALQKYVVITNSPLRGEAQPEIKDKTSKSATSEKSTLPLKPVTIEVPSTTTEGVFNTTTTRSSDHGRSMQYSSTTEESSRSSPASVTPMKLIPLPMTSTPSSTTSTSTPLPTTAVSFASNENVIEESTSKSEVRQLPEKRAKFISENSTNAQQLTLPNTAEVWSLAGMKAVPKAPLTTTTSVPLLNHTDLANDIDMPLNKTELHKEKNLLDWMNIAMLPLTPENRTEFVVRTTLDATEGATQATTEALVEETHSKSDITVGLEQDNVTTARTMPSTPDPGSMDLNMTTTTVRTQQLEVPLVKKMSDAANAKLIEAVTEPQRETEAATEAATFVTLPEKLATFGITARVDSTQTELLNVTTAAAATESGEMSKANSTDTLSAMTSTTTTTARPMSVEHVTPEQDMEAATSLATTAATSSGTTEAAATSSTTAATPVVSEAATAAEASATSEATTAATLSVATTAASTTEIAMKATQISNIRDDNDDNSNDVIVATTKFPESEQAATTASVEPTTTSVSVRVAGEVSTSIRPEIIVTSTRNSTIVDTSTSATSVATPTQTEIAQISNEVNLEAVTVKTRDGLSDTNELRTAEKTDNAVNNSVAITESDLGALATAVETNPTTTNSLLSDVSKLSKEHESSLETNNIGEAPPESTTPAAPATVAVATDESTAAPAATGGQEIVREGQHHEGQQVADEQDTEQQLAKTTMAVTTTTTSATTTTTSTTTTTTESPLTTTTMQPVEISLLDDSTTTTTTTPAPPVYFESSTVASTTIRSSTTMLPETTTASTQSPSQMPPTFMAPYPNELDHMQTNAQDNGTDVNVIIAITVSVIGVVALILLVAFLYLMRKRQKQTSYGQRCRPVSLDAYSLDNVSVLGSVRRKGRDMRASKRTYGNAAFDDPSLRHNLLTASELARFVERRSDVFEEFRDVPQIIARADEVPPGCEDKNR